MVESWQQSPRRADAQRWQQLVGGFPNPYPSIVEYIEFDPAEPDHLFVGTGGGEGARYSYIFKVASRGRYFTALTAATLGSKYRCVSRQSMLWRFSKFNAPYWPRLGLHPSGW